MSEQEQQREHEVPAASGVTIWTSARGVAQWKIKVAAGEDEARVQRALDLALAAHQRAERELTPQAFTGEEPGA